MDGCIDYDRGLGVTNNHGLVCSYDRSQKHQKVGGKREEKSAFYVCTCFCTPVSSYAVLFLERRIMGTYSYRQ